MTRIALDASTLIYFVEGSESLRERIARRLDVVRADPAGQVVASRLARLECRVKPLRNNNAILLSEYEAVFDAARFVLLDVTAAVLDRATDLRARHGFKVPDAIHLASAIEAGADAFLTGDAGLAKCPDVKVEVIAP
ncbi:MAG: type II toxin-antitoxin system VapC family toxin [Labilithrix sp.]|nr:type II toxin-antitoxin system VapC family toxin [Labilithrix sp.]